MAADKRRIFHWKNVQYIANALTVEENRFTREIYTTDATKDATTTENPFMVKSVIDAVKEPSDVNTVHITMLKTITTTPIHVTPSTALILVHANNMRRIAYDHMNIFRTAAKIRQASIVTIRQLRRTEAVGRSLLVKTKQRLLTNTLRYLQPFRSGTRLNLTPAKIFILAQPLEGGAHIKVLSWDTWAHKFTGTFERDGVYERGMGYAIYLDRSVAIPLRTERYHGLDKMVIRDNNFIIGIILERENMGTLFTESTGILDYPDGDETSVFRSGNVISPSNGDRTVPQIDDLLVQLWHKTTPNAILPLRRLMLHRWKNMSASLDDVYQMSYEELTDIINMIQDDTPSENMHDASPSSLERNVSISALLLQQQFARISNKT
jgi:hypothetical protein